MIPFYFEFFKQFQELLTKLFETVNKKWKPEQITAYQKYIVDVNDYITNYIWNGTVTDLNLFYAAMESYGMLTNPIGKELYDIQVEFIQKVEEGYDFRLDKKKKKTEKTKDEKPQEVKKPVLAEKKEEVIIRKGDP